MKIDRDDYPRDEISNETPDVSDFSEHHKPSVRKY
jgi:hypothetical protein